MTQLNRDYNLKMLTYSCNIFKFCHYEWEISPEKNTGLLSLGESLDVAEALFSCLEQRFWVIISSQFDQKAAILS